MFLSAYESIQACQMMEELLGQVKARILDIYKLEFQVETRAQAKRSKEEKQAKWREAKRTAAAVFFRTFGALPEVHFLHTIYHFKALEVKNLTLQTVYDLELKWGRYRLRKTTAPGLCENFAQHLPNSHTPLRRANFPLFLPTPHEIFSFGYFCINFHFLLVFSHSCNSLARKYPRKGKLPSYINSLVNTKKISLDEFFPGNQLMYILHLRKYRDLFCFTFSLSFSWKPNNLWGCFPRGWEAKLLVSWSEGS